MRWTTLLSFFALVLVLAATGCGVQHDAAGTSASADCTACAAATEATSCCSAGTSEAACCEKEGECCQNEKAEVALTPAAPETLPATYQAAEKIAVPSPQ